MRQGSKRTAEPRGASAKRQTVARREADRLFQIGEYWLGFEEGSPFVFYYWYDAGTRRTRRKTTGQRELDEAKKFLAKLVLSEPPSEPQEAEEATLAAVRRWYFKYHINATQKGRDVVRDKSGPKRAWALLTIYMWRHLKQSGIAGAPAVGHFSLAIQHDFIVWLAEEHDLSCKTISTYTSYIKAGIRFAAVPRIVVDARGTKRESRPLESAPYIVSGEAKVSELTGLERSKPRDWIPTDAELAATIDQFHNADPARAPEVEAAFRYTVMALNTIARPEAITDISVKAQVFFGTGLVDINAPGRPQVPSKIRPTIRLTNNLRAWLIYWNLDKPIVYYGDPIDAVSVRTVQKAAKKAGVANWKKFNRYTLRHYMATRIRRVPSVKVEREERAEWMGHTDPEHRTTERHYESMDPDYLVNVRDAIDAIMLHLSALMKVRSLIPPNVVTRSGLTLIENAAPVAPQQRDASA
jgi:integrase